MSEKHDMRRRNLLKLIALMPVPVVLTKGRAVGKSTDLASDSLARSAKIAGEHDICVKIVEIPFTTRPITGFKIIKEEVGIVVANLKGVKKLELKS